MERRAKQIVRGVLIVGGIFSVYWALIFFFLGPRYHISPDMVRESERHDFDESFGGGVPAQPKSFREDPSP
jgi:hypothetical protein